MCMLLVGARYQYLTLTLPALSLFYSHTAYDWERPHLSFIPSVHILYVV